jgi:hypothetical protein
MAATHARKEEVCLYRLCSGIGLVQQVVRIYYDIRSVIFFVRNPYYHSKRNHIDVQYRFVRYMVEEKNILLVKVETLDNVAYSSTKSMRTKNLSWCRESMGTSSLDC